MECIDIKAFRKANNLSQNQLGDYLGIDKGFISAIEHGKSKFPKAKLTLLLNNPHNWDISMLTEPKTPATDQPMESTLVSYLERKVSDQEILIRELYQQIGMLEAKLDLARKGEIAGTADGSLSASAI